MNSKLRFTFSALLWAMLLLAAYAVTAHAQTSDTTNLHPAKKEGSIQPAGTTAPPVTGQGTVGYLTKWTGSKNSVFTIGDTIIFEDTFARIGIGTSAPTSKLTVQGMIETTLGGYKFPDGTCRRQPPLVDCNPFFAIRR